MGNSGDRCFRNGAELGQPGAEALLPAKTDGPNGIASSSNRILDEVQPAVVAIGSDRPLAPHRRHYTKMLSEVEVADLVARLKRVAVDGVSRDEAPGLAGALKEAEVAILACLIRPTKQQGNEDDFATRTVLTVREIANELQVPRAAIYELCRTRELRSFRVGKHVRIRRTALEDYLKRVDRSLYSVYNGSREGKRAARRPRKSRTDAAAAR